MNSSACNAVSYGKRSSRLPSDISFSCTGLYAIAAISWSMDQDVTVNVLSFPWLTQGRSCSSRLFNVFGIMIHSCVPPFHTVQLYGCSRPDNAALWQASMRQRVPATVTGLQRSSTTTSGLPILLLTARGSQLLLSATLKVSCSAGRRSSSCVLSSAVYWIPAPQPTWFSLSVLHLPNHSGSHTLPRCFIS